MRNVPKILKVMFALFFVLQIIFYNNIYANRVDVTKLDRYLDKLEMNNENIFSLSVTEKGNPVYLRSIGFMDPSFTNHSNVNTRYRIGELSKSFTSVIVMQMVEEKMIQFGTPISRFFPEIPNGKHISIKDLLSHRVNIMNYLPSGKFYTAIKSDYVFDELLKEDQSDFQPEFAFSDPNYLVLGLIIEKISNKTYSEIIMERIIDKVGLDNTFSISENSTEKNSSNEIIGKWDLNSLSGSGSIVSTPGDLGKFMNALFYEDLINDRSLRTLLSFDEGLNIGLKKLTAGNRQGFGYSGSMDGFYSKMTYFPADSICISFSSKGNNTETLDDLVKIIYGS